MNRDGRPPLPPAPPELMAELIAARHGGYLDRLLMQRNFRHTLDVVRDASAAIAKMNEEDHAKVRARIASGGRKPSYSELSKGAFEPVAKVWRADGSVLEWQHWLPADDDGV